MNHDTRLNDKRFVASGLLLGGILFSQDIIIAQINRELSVIDLTKPLSSLRVRVILPYRYKAAQGLLTMNLVILNHGQGKRTTPEMTFPSPNFGKTSLRLRGLSPEFGLLKENSRKRTKMPTEQEAKPAVVTPSLQQWRSPSTFRGAPGEDHSQMA
ncbi:hypothetical protein TNCV_4483471 [Trichonephila clavipes]|nr:hypothetical protein TNCV_4483471 [Trichonephila clavipes]